MEGRGRGRGYGRSRGQAAAAQAAGGGQQRPGSGPEPTPAAVQGQATSRAPLPQGAPAARAPLPQGAPAARAPPPSVWVRPPQPAAPAQSAWPRLQMGAPQQHQQVAGRGERQEFEEGGATSRKVTGDGDRSNQDVAREGSQVRGNYKRRETIFRTKPEQMDSKKGAIGTPITLYANYLCLVKSGKWCLNQYRVDMAPDVDNTGKRKALVRTAARELLSGGYLFDGTVLYTPQMINNNTVELFATDDNGENIRITIRLVGEVAWGDMHYIQLFNIIVRKCLQQMEMQMVGRNYFMPANKVVIPEHNVQLWPGYFTSMRQHETDILLNVDLQFKFMRTDTVYDILLECQGPNARKEFQAKIIGSVVLTHYNNRTYKIDDVDFNCSPAHSFKMSDGSEITYKEYYNKRYKVDIRVRDQPMLISRSKPREIRAGMPETVYLVPELCRMTGLTDKQRENFQLMKQLATYTRIGVEERIGKLMEFSHRFKRLENIEELRRWDLEIADQLVQFQGRVLPTETMIGGNNSRYSAGQQADWTRDLRSKPMLFMPKMERLAVVCPGRLKSATQDFVQTLCKTATGMRWNLGSPKIFDIQDDRSGSYIEQIEKIINAAQPTLILVILTNNSKDRYSAIKKKCYVDRGVPTQMFVGRNLTNKGIMSIATKVAVQMNCKIGGAPWSVILPLSNLMIVGYDVCRDTVNKKKSFAGMVASLDKNITRYYNVAFEHSMAEELSNNFAASMVLACKRWKKENGCYPEKIVIYRDGVGDGQLPFVMEHEVANIKRKLKEEIYKDTDIKLAFVVVSKRINTRIFTRKDNPPPGTVVDDVITLPERYDFFIVSQCVRQGTVSPTSYNVIEDTLGLTPEKLQFLTYKLTHMYYNWSGTVRVPAPCQYAHKLAFMVSQNLHRPAHPDLEDVLYYL